MRDMGEKVWDMFFLGRGLGDLSLSRQAERRKGGAENERERGRCKEGRLQEWHSFVPC